MRKLLVTCECGQKMQVPRSAIGKMGMCPTCGRTTRISAANTAPMTERRRGANTARRVTWDSDGANQPSEDAKQRFGQAVDFYYAQRYAESLAVFDALLKEFPGNPDIEHGRQQCIRAMQRPQLGPPSKSQPLLAQGNLDHETVRRIVLDKLLNGSTDAVQLQAAELACKYFGAAEPEEAENESEETNDAAQSEDDQIDDTEDDEYSERISRFPSEDAL